MGNQSRLGDLFNLGTVLRWALVLAAGAMVLAAAPSGLGMLAQIGVGVLIFLAAFATGAILGFVFCVPKAVDPAAVVAPPASDPAQAGAESVTTAGATGFGRLLNTNTALERISEWLATMLVGVGLSQLYNINALLIGFRDFLKQFGPAGSLLPAIGPMILIIGAITGFLFMYVFTRLILPSAFYRAELNNRGEALDPAASTAVREAARAAEAQPAGNAESVAPAPALSKADSYTISSVANTPAPSTDDALRLMLTLLYKEPDGYREVIDLGSRLEGSTAARRVEFWYYLAAAYGQLHAATGDVAEKARARDRAIEAARRAIAIDPAIKSRLLWMTNPAPGSQDDDLKSLQGDREWLALLR